MRARCWTAGLLAAAALMGGSSVQVAELTATQALGKLIFFDTNLSINRNQSCGSCHVPGVGWTRPDQAVNAAGAVYGA